MDSKVTVHTRSRYSSTLLQDSTHFQFTCAIASSPNTASLLKPCLFIICLLQLSFLGNPWDSAVALENLHPWKVQKKSFVGAWTLLIWRLTSFEVANPAPHWVHFAGRVWDFLWWLRVEILASRVCWIGNILTDTHVYARKSSRNPEIHIRSGLLRLKPVLTVTGSCQVQRLMDYWGCSLQALTVEDLMNLHCWEYFV